MIGIYITSVYKKVLKKIVQSKNIFKIYILIIPLSLSARLAQSVERGTFNPEVKGSSPLSGELLLSFV